MENMDAGLASSGTLLPRRDQIRGLATHLAVNEIPMRARLANTPPLTFITVDRDADGCRQLLVGVDGRCYQSNISATPSRAAGGCSTCRSQAVPPETRFRAI